MNEPLDLDNYVILVRDGTEDDPEYMWLGFTTGLENVVCRARNKSDAECLLIAYTDNSSDFVPIAQGQPLDIIGHIDRLDQ